MNQYIYIASFGLGVLGSWLVARKAQKLGFIDLPNHRSSHTMPTPKGGGIGILLAFLLGSIFFDINPLFWSAALLLSLTSLIGDRIEIPPKWRLVVQFFSALLVVSSYLWVKPHDEITVVLLLFYITAYSVLIVGTANFFNFMDGINGIAGITGVICFGLIALFGAVYDVDTTYVKLSICISASCLGFLPFNVPNAKVFMGDVGSVLLGFVFACMVMEVSRDITELICILSFLFPFYADELTTMLIRMRDREDLSSPHRRHLYQLIVNELKAKHWKVSVGYGLFQLIVGICVIRAKADGLIPVLIVLGLSSFCFVITSMIVRKKINQINSI